MRLPADEVTALAARIVRIPWSLIAVVVLLVAALGTASPRPLRTAPPTQGNVLRVLTYNIKHGLGTDGRVDLERSATLIRELEPDLVALQEIDQGAERTGGVAQARELGRRTAMASFFGPFMPFQGGHYGMALLSKLPYRDLTNHQLPDGAEPRAAAAARVALPTGEELVFVGVHLYRTEDERLAQVRSLLRLYEDEEAPVILAGDFNSEPGSRVMEEVARAFRVLPKEGSPPTFPSDAPDREIDFIAVRPDERFEVLESRVIEETVVSDHRPVLAVLRLDRP